MDRNAIRFGAMLLMVAAAVVPLRSSKARAQIAAPAINCSATTIASPMQGHYTGPWHSDAAYHFYVFGRDLELQITIDGTLDATLTPDGHISGSVQGQVNAPVTHDGHQDVSSGYGTISGQLQGVFAPGSSLVVLPHPVIDMHWGTFVGGGYTVERLITMPDYHFPVGNLDCISAGGAIGEQGFPTMNIVADGAGMITQAPGLGLATGTWQLSSDGASVFAQLSQQVDGLLGQASSLLNNSTTLTPAALIVQVVQPLQQLEATIRQHPDVARCLLDRIGAWEASMLPALLTRAQSFAASDIVALRHGFDLLRSTDVLNLDCNISETNVRAALWARGQAILNAAITTRSWSTTALAVRELLLAGGESSRSALQQEINGGFHDLVRSGASGQSLLDGARLSYAFGDDPDAAAVQTAPAFRRLVVPANYATKRKKHHKTPSKPATPTPTVTPTPVLKTLQQVLTIGIAAIKPSAVNGAELRWVPVAGAQSYVVTATSAQDPKLLWAWAGTATSVIYGDTTLEGVAGTTGDNWSDASQPYSWSVLALNGGGQVVGAAFRVNQ